MLMHSTPLIETHTGVRRREDELYLLQRRREDELQLTQRHREDELQRTQRHLEDELQLTQRRREVELREMLAKADKDERINVEAEDTASRAETKCLAKPSVLMYSTPLTETHTKVHGLSALVEALQIPKTELMTFDGDPLKYWMFVRSFENSVEKNYIGDAARLTLLLQYCTGKAKKVIQCCAVMTPTDGYSAARRLLEERFGNDYNITQAWIDKIVNRPNATDNVSLMDLADDLMSCRETLNTMNRLGEVNNSRSLLQIIQKLPRYLQTR
jgi:hypothetical protein